MEEPVQIDCYNCKILYPRMPKCGVCGGTGVRVQPARLDDDSVAHDILRDALGRADAEGATILSGRSGLVRTLICWQLYGPAYVKIEKGFAPGTPQHARELNRIRDEIVTTIRKMDRL
ncbi:MAG: hypothetical protein HYY17_00895 [Planctomycetes bacterium]|nr:hypothetical protein [Planctomycetota bacterium]